MKKSVLKKIFVIYINLLILVVILKFDRGFDKIINIHQSIISNKELGLLNVNFVLMRTISPYLKNLNEPYALFNIMGNIIPFIPLGFFLSQIYFRKNFIKTFILYLFVLIFIELVQLVLMIGYFDVDDIFLNSIGCIIGYLFSLIYIHFKKKFYNCTNRKGGI